MQHHRACQVQLVGIGFHFKLLSGILQVTDPLGEKKPRAWTGKASLRVQTAGTCSPTYTRRCEPRRWGPPLTSSPSFPSVAPLWACGLRWLLREPCEQRTQPGGVRATSRIRERQTQLRFDTYFCLLAIWARTWASTFVGSWTASVPSTLIRLEIRTGRKGGGDTNISCVDLKWWWH